MISAAESLIQRCSGHLSGYKIEALPGVLRQTLIMIPLKNLKPKGSGKAIVLTPSSGDVQLMKQ